jgi:DNA-binding XRE family transcriptional regulator
VILSTKNVYRKRIARKSIRVNEFRVWYTKGMNITPALSRAARGLLDWSQSELGAHSNLSESTIRDFEKGRRVPGPNNLAAIQHALEAAGVIFVAENGEGPGVRLRKGR